MDKELKLLADNYKLDQLYKNNLFTLKSICEFLGVWNNYTQEQQFQLENFTAKDSNLNKHYTYKGTYDNNYVYGEILRSGVDKLIEKIKKYKTITEKDVFIDIGSGCGKLVLHTAVTSPIKTIIGVEVVPQRQRYSKWIQNTLSIPEKSVFLIEKDIRDFDLSIVSIVFMNDICFDNELTWNIYERLPKGCHFITTKQVNACKILKEEFTVESSWDKKLKLNYYIK